jgi:hypothetical protein
MTRTSRTRTSEASLYVVEPTPDQHEPQGPPAQEPTSGASSSKAPQPDGAIPDIDAVSTEMAGDAAARGAPAHEILNAAGRPV